MTVRLGLVGAGWVARLHLEALERLGRTELVGVTSRTLAGAETLTGSLRSELDPYERQAAAFLDAIDRRDPTLALSGYADALRTDRLARAVVAATGRPG